MPAESTAPTVEHHREQILTGSARIEIPTTAPRTETPTTQLSEGSGEKHLQVAYEGGERRDRDQDRGMYGAVGPRGQDQQPVALGGIRLPGRGPRVVEHLMGERR